PPSASTPESTKPLEAVSTLLTAGPVSCFVTGSKTARKIVGHNPRKTQTAVRRPWPSSIVVEASCACLACSLRGCARNVIPHSFAQSAHFIHVARLRGVKHRASAEEQQRFKDGMVNRVVKARNQCQRCKQRMIIVQKHQSRSQTH